VQSSLMVLIQATNNVIRATVAGGVIRNTGNSHRQPSLTYTYFFTETCIDTRGTNCARQLPSANQKQPATRHLTSTLGISLIL
jgi:hypothetical protein